MLPVHVCQGQSLHLNYMPANLILTKDQSLDKTWTQKHSVLS